MTIVPSELLNCIIRSLNITETRRTRMNVLWITQTESVDI